MKITKITDIGTIQQATFQDDAEVLRVAQSGLAWVPMGFSGSAIRVGESTPVMFYNTTGATVLVGFGPQTVTAPATAATGLPVPAGQTVVYNSGDNAWCIGSAGVAVYMAVSN